MRKGFTMIETVIATSLIALLIGAATSSWIMFMHKSNRVNQQSILDMDARNVVERFRAEMRNAARETIIFYPENVEPYQALGFALAEDTDGDGLMDMDAQGSNILWRQTVVYHVWNADPPQMRRTLFSNRNNAADYAAYYSQISSVYESGSGQAACLSGERAQTAVLFANLFTGKLWHAESVFDGYTSKPNTSSLETFGSISLGPGAHTLDLIVVGKHPSATARNIWLDQLSLGVSGWPLEAERRLTSKVSAMPAFIGPNQAGAGYGLASVMSGDGDKISITLYNDAIEEAEFIGKGRNVSLSNTVVRFDTDLTPAGFGEGAYVTKLDGQFAAMWQGGAQSGDGLRSEYYFATNCVMRIPVLAPWVTADGYGPVFRIYKSLYNSGIVVRNPVFAVVPTPATLSALTPDIDPGANIPLEFFQNGVKMTGWTACAAKNYVDLRPQKSIRIEIGTTLMLTFQVTVNAYGSDRFTAFDMKRPGVPGCWMIPGGDAAAVNQAVWSGDPRLTAISKLPCLESIAVNFADNGEYISHAYDTRSEAGATRTIEWDADLPAGTELRIYTRSGSQLSGDGFTIADAPAWTEMAPTSNGGTVNGTGRYLQFRAEMMSQPFSQFPEKSGILTGPYRSETPRLHHVLIRWDGETKYVDIMANLLKSPDCGMFRVEVDGKPLIRGVNMEIEIFKNIRSMGGTSEKIRSSMMAEVEPRNSKKKQ